MRKYFFALMFLVFSPYALSLCDSYVSTLETPSDTLPNITEFLLGYNDGFYQFNGNPNPSSGLVLSYWHAEKVTFPDIPSYISVSDGSTVGYSLNGCLPLDSDGTGVHCMYLEYFSKTCPIGYEIDFSTATCELTDLQACLDSAPQICEDGLPPNLAGYYGCDRPALKECSDGSYVRADLGICPVPCTDYLSCYLHALESSSCAGAQYSEFEYVDPENWSLSCSQIDENSPDHPDNGGNGDGNPYNDPNTPDIGEGSTQNTSNIDPYTLAGLIGDELRPGFSDVERAIRDDIDQSKTNTETLETAIGEVESAVRDSIQSGENNTNAITNSLDILGSKLDGLNDSLNSGPCDPNQPDYYSCLDIPTGNLPSHSQSEASSIAEANANFKSRIDNSDIVQAFTGMADLLSLENADCPMFSIDLTATIINQNISTSIHCDLMESIRPVISPVMIIIFIWIAFKIFASA